MIKKLTKRIRLLIQIPMILLIVMISAVFMYMNYTSIMSNAEDTLNRFSVVSNDGETSDGNMIEPENKEPHKNEEEKPKGDADNQKNESYGVLYEYDIQEGKVSYQTSDDADAAKAAVGLAGNDEGSGIKNGYFYRVQKKGAQNYSVKLLKNDNLYQRFVLANVMTIVILVVGIIVIIAVSFFVSKIVIEPVRKNEQKQKAFISDTSHELKTPLAVIEANAEVLEADIGKNKWLDYIQHEAAGMERLVSSLLFLSRAESADNSVIYTAFDLSHRAEICASAFEALAFEKGITLSSNIEQDIIFTGNEYDIDSIISPLTDNAIKHTLKGGNVELSLAREKNGVIITVRNEGEPIPDDEIDKIFDRFYRVDKARNRSENRYGLGLSIVQALAQRYDGGVSVKCENGITAFSVALKNR